MKIHNRYYYHDYIDFTQRGLSRAEYRLRKTSNIILEDVFTPPVMDVLHNICSNYPISRNELKHAIRKAVIYYRRKGKPLKKEYIYAVAYLLLINKGIPININEYIKFVKKYHKISPTSLRSATVELSTANIIKVLPTRWTRVWRYVMYYLRKKGLMREDVLKEVRDVYVKVRYEFQHSHKRSSSIAGAILYIALNKAGVRTTFRELAEHLKCSEWTIRFCKKAILKNTRLIKWWKVS